MTEANNILEVSTLHPDYLGFIFHESSSRYFKGIISKVPESIKKTGVFVDSSFETIENQINQHQLDAVQLHGSESPELCQRLKPKGVEVIKVFSVDDNFNFSNIEAYQGHCHYYLFDTKGKLPGGNGITFNWNVLESYNGSTPYFLSGGLGIENLSDIKLFLQSPISDKCLGIDLNSKFETAPGIKSKSKLTKFINQLKL